jgi:hypothetical protein
MLTSELAAPLILLIANGTDSNYRVPFLGWHVAARLAILRELAGGVKQLAAYSAVQMTHHVGWSLRHTGLILEEGVKNVFPTE